MLASVAILDFAKNLWKITACIGRQRGVPTIYFCFETFLLHNIATF